MQQRRGTAAQWTTANPILAAGEIGFETDTSKFKMGNGTSAWSALQYYASAAELNTAISNLIDAAPGTLDTLNELAAAIGDDPNFFNNISEDFASAIDMHNADTSVHGIANTALLATLTNVSTAKQEAIDAAETDAEAKVLSHANLTSNVHGILDTSDLATSSSVASAISGHNSDETNVHGIVNTADLALISDVTDHNSSLTDVHGIADTSALATKSYADGAVSTHNTDTTQVHGIEDTSLLATKTYADTAVSTHAALTEDVHGIADVSLLATQEYVDTAIGTAAVDQSALAGVGLNWNLVSEAFDIDSTVATKTYADGAVSSAVTALTKSSVGLANVDNTSDANKPVSDATQTALNLKAPLANPTFTGTVAGVTKSHVGLENVDNTSDANKPVSTATQTALDLKANKAAPTFTGTVTASNDLVIDGNLTVNGTTFNASSTSIVIEDNLVQLAHQNAGNSVDLGIVVAYNDGAAKHAGIARDVSDDKWRLFKGVTSEPTTTVNFGQGSLDNLAVAGLEATTVTVSTGVAFSDGTQSKEGVPSRTPIIAKTDSYTLSALTERDSLIEVAKATATTITIPTDATLNFPVGTSIDILQTSTGQVTIAGAGGVTVNATPGLKLRTTWSSATLFKRAANTWVVYGDLTA